LRQGWKIDLIEKIRRRGQAVAVARGLPLYQYKL